MGPGFTVEVLMHRWKSMRETFQDNLNRVKESDRRSSGNGTDDCYVPKWKLWTKLQFLKKTCAQSESVSNLPQSSSVPQLQQEIASLIEFPAVYYDDQTKRYVQIPSESSSMSPLLVSEVDLSGEKCDQSEVLSRPPSRPAPVNSPMATPSSSSQEMFVKRGATKRKSTAAIDEALKVVKEMAMAPVPVPAPVVLDSVDHLMAYLATRLRAMEAERRQECENQLLTTVLNFPSKV
ncbi:hypothetical protein FOCC_FOCC015317 [Frankliniella occidentalis]|nr:hypothetical protein FOCC_FOCC015317 [Frankliniella occidentalis]